MSETTPTVVLANKLTETLQDVELPADEIFDALILTMQMVVGVDNTARLISDRAPKRSVY